MTLDKTQAAQALAEIGASQRRSSTLYSYTRTAPYLFLGGLMWLVADLLLQFSRFNKGLIWPVTSLAGTLAMVFVALRQTKGDAAANTTPEAKARGDGIFWRSMGVWLAAFAFMAATFTIFYPANGYQTHSFIGVFCGCVYVAMGLWMGWRMIAIGVALTVLTMFGFFEIHHYYLAYMGVVGGGALMLSAVWLQDGVMQGPDEVIHQSTRLKLMATLRVIPPEEMVEFTRLKAILKITDGNLGTHLSALEKAGYIEVAKDFMGKKPRTRVAMTRAGRAAFETHVAYLRDIIDG